jgi:hypothetical protein
MGPPPRCGKPNRSGVAPRPPVARVLRVLLAESRCGQHDAISPLGRHLAQLSSCLRTWEDIQEMVASVCCVMNPKYETRLGAASQS